MADPPEINEYTVGETVVLEANFTKLGEPLNPTTVTCTIKPPDKTAPVVTVPVTNPEIGRFVAEYVVDDHGDHWYLFEGTGAVTALKEWRFRGKKRHVSAVP